MEVSWKRSEPWSTFTVSTENTQKGYASFLWKYMWTLLAGSDEPNEITILKDISIDESNIIYIRQIEIEQENRLALHLKIFTVLRNHWKKNSSEEIRTK